MNAEARIRELEAQVVQLSGTVDRLSARRGVHGEHEHHLVNDVRHAVDQVILADVDEAIETHVGAVWVSRLAAVVIMMALALAARTTFANQEIEELGKAFIGYGLAVTFIGYGLFFELRRDLFAQAILGCGLAVLYFTTYAIFFIPEMQLHDEPYWGIPITMACLGILVLMAHVRSSETVAGAGLFLAYYTVYVSCSQSPTLSSHIHAVATCAVLAVTALLYQASHRWLLFTWVVMAATYTIHAYFYVEQPTNLPLASDRYLWASLGFLTVCFLLFTASAIVEGRRPGAFRPMVAPLAATNTVVYYFFLWRALETHYPSYTWIFQVGLGLVLLLCAILSETRGKQSNHLFQVFSLASIVIFTLSLSAALSTEFFLIAMALECVALSLFFQRSGVVGFKIIELILMLATGVAVLPTAGMTDPVQLGEWLVPTNRFCGAAIALLFILNAWIYEKFTVPIAPGKRTRSGHWFLADSFLDWTGSSMAMAHAACGCFVLLTLTILEFSKAPELPYILAGEGLVVFLLGLALLTPQICVGAVMLLISAHVCYHVFLWLPLEGFETQQYFIVCTVALSVLTFLGGHAWERYLWRFRRVGIDWEHHIIAAVPFLIGTYLLTDLLLRELTPLHVAAAQGGLGLGLLLLGSFSRYTGVKASGILAMMFALQSFYGGLNDPDMPLDREPLFLLYFGIFLGTCVGAERLFALLAKRSSVTTTRIEDALRTVLVFMAMLLGLLGLYRWSPEQYQIFYLLAYAVIVLVLGVVFRERRYRWGALLLLGFIIYRAFTRFQEMPPLYQVLMFGVSGLVLVIVSWAYSRRIARARDASSTDGPATPHA
ncbi:MAG: DUF2339 domain-containing protein [Candidatus Hydrogenedentes bacterium]|nr:DUF2339 domain-containing protein [Candidatus Hydrogenedentota bacterium]